uniref:Uncharacterized protein n=1 Tax=uncultured marine virus TaxID=186617 RepID=A0A0F7LB65_9VIRU|nr:hypothetical protein [uncultured marine virus]
MTLHHLTHKPLLSQWEEQWMMLLSLLQLVQPQQVKLVLVVNLLKQQSLLMLVQEQV